MVFGIFLILLACVVNAALVLIPGVVAEVVSFFVNGFFHKLKIRNETLEQWVRTVIYLGSLLFAASLQIYLWKLKPGIEPLRWTVAQAVFVLGTGTVLICRIYASESPSGRAWSARRFMMGAVLLSAVLAACYGHPGIHSVVESTPGKVFVFIFGRFGGGDTSNTSK